MSREGVFDGAVVVTAAAAAGLGASFRRAHNHPAGAAGAGFGVLGESLAGGAFGAASGLGASRAATTTPSPLVTVIGELPAGEPSMAGDCKCTRRRLAVGGHLGEIVHNVPAGRLGLHRERVAVCYARKYTM